MSEELEIIARQDGTVEIAANIQGEANIEANLEQPAEIAVEIQAAGPRGPEGKGGDKGDPGEDGISPGVTVSSIAGGHSVKITDADHPDGQTFNVMDGQDGQDGTDGVSPGVTVTDITGGHRVTITDADHPAGQTFDVMDGENGQDGQDGQDGVSPEVTVTNITGGHRVTITDADHPSGQTFDVMDGEDGQNGVGVPAGGTAGQFLKKSSGADYDDEWGDISIPAAATSTPEDLGTAAVGTSAKYAREDHVHKMPSYGEMTQKASGTADLNDYTSAGIFYFSNSVTLSNQPTGATNGWLVVLPSASSNYVEQIFVQQGISGSNYWNTYLRGRFSGTWENWVRCSTEMQMPTGAYDLNDFTNPGLFFFSGASTLSNQPSGNAAGWLCVLVAGTVTKQLWYRSSVGGVSDTYQRLNDSGTWTAWVRFSMDTDTQDGSSSITDSNGAAARKYLYKTNHIVYLAYQSSSRAWSQGDSICTIPSGFRPTVDTFYLNGMNNNKVANIQVAKTTGIVTVNQLETVTGNSRIYINGWWYV